MCPPFREYGRMAEGRRYEPEDDDILVHRFNDNYGIVYFSLRTGYGVGNPNFFVCLDENGGERSWWLDPEQAEILGKKLVGYAAECQERNAQEQRRIAEWKESYPDPQEK